MRTLILVPDNVRRGQTVQLRVTAAHPMETGHRRGADGERLPRNIVRRFECRFDGELVFAADLFPAISANPYLAFSMVAQASGTLTFSWQGDLGLSHSESRALVVT